MSERMSAALARATLSRGLALRAIREAAALPATDEIRFFRGAGTSIKALGRAAQKMIRRPDIVYAKVRGSVDAPVLVSISRTAGRDILEKRSGNANAEHACDLITYYSIIFDPRTQRLAWCHLPVLAHALQRWAERGIGDPREALLAQLDAEVIRILTLGDILDRALEHASRRGPTDARTTFGVPADGGIWVAATHGERNSNGRMSNGLSLRTFLGEAEMNEERRAYRAVALSQDIVAAERQWPEAFTSGH
ncbi:hypothetical protein PVT71_29175 (plasmid) [Salipiger sp. H15]|uniref:Uncharacterized protein n=1 Tax=Alloyangia sp. H15 TaxID=3029062 RepID=A0AAU8AT82_9RHOB